MGKFINFNGELLPEDQPVFTAASRAARFGDGLFETMRMNNGQVLFAEQHASRLFKGLQLLQFKLPKDFTWNFLENEIARLAKKNNCSPHARIRLMVVRGEGAISDEPINSPQFLIECWPTEIYSFNQKGISLGIFEEARKSNDHYSSIKSANFLPYVMAMEFAKGKGWDECLLLNSEHRVCDGTISNVFWIRGSGICTPPLSEGGIAGVMRSFLLEALLYNGYFVEEEQCTIKELLGADEIFLTNVVRGIRWVSTLQEKAYKNDITTKIFNELIKPLM